MSIGITFESNATSTKKELGDISKALADVVLSGNKASGTLGSISLSSELPNALRGVRSELSKISVQAPTALSGLNGAAEKTSKNMYKLSTLISHVSAVAAVTGSAGFLAVSADLATNLSNRLGLVIEDQSAIAAKNKELFQISKETLSSHEATVGLFVNLQSSLSKLGKTDSEITSVLKTLNQTAVLSGSSAETLKASFTQLNQGLGAGAIRGEELNSVMEGMPFLIKVVTENLGLTTAELRKFAEEGKFTSEVLFEALSKSSEEVDAKFKRSTLTVGGASALLSGSIKKFVGELLNYTGASGLLANRLLNASKSVDAFAVSLFSSLDKASAAIKEFKGDSDLLTAVSSKISKSLKSVTLGNIEGLVRKVASTIKDLLGSPLNTIREFTAGASDAFFDLYDKVVGRSYIPDMVQEVSDWLSKLSAPFSRLLRSLRDIVSGFEFTKESAVNLALFLSPGLFSAVTAAANSLSSASTVAAESVMSLLNALVETEKRAAISLINIRDETTETAVNGLSSIKAVLAAKSVLAKDTVFRFDPSGFKAAIQKASQIDLREATISLGANIAAATLSGMLLFSGKLTETLFGLTLLLGLVKDAADELNEGFGEVAVQNILAISTEVAVRVGSIFVDGVLRGASLLRTLLPAVFDGIVDGLGVGILSSLVPNILKALTVAAGATILLSDSIRDAVFSALSFSNLFPLLEVSAAGAVAGNLAGVAFVSAIFGVISKSEALFVGIPALLIAALGPKGAVRLVLESLKAVTGVDLVTRFFGPKALLISNVGTIAESFKTLLFNLADGRAKFAKGAISVSELFFGTKLDKVSEIDTKSKLFKTLPEDQKSEILRLKELVKEREKLIRTNSSGEPSQDPEIFGRLTTKGFKVVDNQDFRGELKKAATNIKKTFLDFLIPNKSELDKLNDALVPVSEINLSTNPYSKLEQSQKEYIRRLREKVKESNKLNNDLGNPQDFEIFGAVSEQGEFRVLGQRGEDLDIQEEIDRNKKELEGDFFTLAPQSQTRVKEAAQELFSGLKGTLEAAFSVAKGSYAAIQKIFNEPLKVSNIVEGIEGLFKIFKALGIAMVPVTVSVGLVLTLFSSFASASNGIVENLADISHILHNATLLIGLFIGTLYLFGSALNSLGDALGGSIGDSIREFTAKAAKAIFNTGLLLLVAKVKASLIVLGFIVKSLLENLVPFFLFVGKIAIGLTAFGAIGAMLFGEGNTIEERIANLYDSLRSLVGLTKVTEVGRRTAVQSKLGDPKDFANDINLSGLVATVDFKALSNAQFEGFQAYAESTGSKIQELRKSFFENNTLTAEQNKELNNIFKTTQQIVSRLPPLGGSVTSAQTLDALVRKTSEADTGAEILLRNFFRSLTGVGRVQEPAEFRPREIGFLDDFSRVAGEYFTGAKEFAQSFGNTSKGLPTAISKSLENLFGERLSESDTDLADFLSAFQQTLIQFKDSITPEQLSEIEKLASRDLDISTRIAELSRTVERLNTFRTTSEGLRIQTNPAAEKALQELRQLLNLQESSRGLLYSAILKLDSTISRSGLLSVAEKPFSQQTASLEAQGVSGVDTRVGGQQLLDLVGSIQTFVSSARLLVEPDSESPQLIKALDNFLESSVKGVTSASERFSSTDSAKEALKALVPGLETEVEDLFKRGGEELLRVLDSARTATQAKAIGDSLPIGPSRKLLGADLQILADQFVSTVESIKKTLSKPLTFDVSVILDKINSSLKLDLDLASLSDLPEELSSALLDTASRFEVAMKSALKSSFGEVSVLQKALADISKSFKISQLFKLPDDQSLSALFEGAKPNIPLEDFIRLPEDSRDVLSEELQATNILEKGLLEFNLSKETQKLIQDGLSGGKGAVSVLEEVKLKADGEFKDLLSSMETPLQKVTTALYSLRDTIASSPVLGTGTTPEPIGKPVVGSTPSKAVLDSVTESKRATQEFFQRLSLESLPSLEAIPKAAPLVGLSIPEGALSNLDPEALLKLKLDVLSLVDLRNQIGAGDRSLEDTTDLSKRLKEGVKAIQKSLEIAADLSKEAGEAFLSNLRSGAESSLRSFISGQSKFKDFVSSVVDSFTSTVIDAFTQGLVKQLVTDRVKDTFVSLGQGIFELPGKLLGVSGGKEEGGKQDTTGVLSNFKGLLGEMSESIGASGILRGFKRLLLSILEIISDTDLFKGITDLLGGGGLFGGGSVGAPSSGGGLFSGILKGIRGLFGFSEGGYVQAFADGGYVSGQGTGTSDSIRAMLSDGEFVVNAGATRANRNVLETINSGGRLPSSSSRPHSVSNKQNVTVNVTGDISRQTRRTVLEMIPEIARNVGLYNRELN